MNHISTYHPNSRPSILFPTTKFQKGRHILFTIYTHLKPKGNLISPCQLSLPSGQDMSRCSFSLLQSLKKILCLHFCFKRRRGTFSTITNSEDDKFSFVVKINRIHKRHAADKQICDKDKQAVRRNHRDYRLSLS